MPLYMQYMPVAALRSFHWKLLCWCVNPPKPSLAPELLESSRAGNVHRFVTCSAESPAGRRFSRADEVLWESGETSPLLISTITLSETGKEDMMWAISKWINHFSCPYVLPSFHYEISVSHFPAECGEAVSNSLNSNWVNIAFEAGVNICSAAGDKSLAAFLCHHFQASIYLSQHASLAKTGSYCCLNICSLKVECAKAVFAFRGDLTVFPGGRTLQSLVAFTVRVLAGCILPTNQASRWLDILPLLFGKSLAYCRYSFCGLLFTVHSHRTWENNTFLMSHQLETTCTLSFAFSSHQLDKMRSDGSRIMAASGGSDLIQLSTILQKATNQPSIPHPWPPTPAGAMVRKCFKYSHTWLKSCRVPQMDENKAAGLVSRPGQRKWCAKWCKQGCRGGLTAKLRRKLHRTSIPYKPALQHVLPG